MAGTLRQIRRRIRSIQSTAKITRAMELVAASKMRRTQARALAARPYAEKMRWVLADLAETLPFVDAEMLPPLLRRHDDVKAVEVVYVTPDRGLKPAASTASPGDSLGPAPDSSLRSE